MQSFHVTFVEVSFLYAVQVWWRVCSELHSISQCITNTDVYSYIQAMGQNCVSEKSCTNIDE